MKTYAELVEWIQQHVKLAEGETSEESAIWFVAYQVALELAELTIKDLSREVTVGIGPVNEAYINLWLGDYYDDYVEVKPDGSTSDNAEDAENDLTLLLEGFFGTSID